MASAPSALSAAVNTRVICFFEGSDNASVHIYILVIWDTGLLHSILLHGREVVREAGGSVHGRLIGGIVVDGVVIYHQVRLEAFVVLSGSSGNSRHIDTAQAFEDGTIDRTVHQSAGSIAHACIQQ